MERTNKTLEDELLPPDYTGHPEDDCPEDDIIEETDEDARIEQLLNEQSLEEKKQQMSNNNSTPFTSSPSFSPSFASGGNRGNNTAPWEKQQQQSTPSWGSSWGSGSSFGGSNPWGNNNQTQQNRNVGNNTNSPTINTKTKSIIICDAMDCLVETYESNGKPGYLPRAIFDLKPKFDVWEKLASFNPEKIFIIFPPDQLVPSLGEKSASKVAMEYIVLCVSTYLRIPRSECTVLQQKNQYTPKNKFLASIVQGIGRNKEDFVYIGVNSGRYGLSNRDLAAAREVGIDYIDIFNLLDGYYLYE